MTLLRIGTLAALVSLAPFTYAEKPPVSDEPKILSIFPLGGPLGGPASRSYTATIRGLHLKAATGVWFPGTGLRARVLTVDTTEAAIDGATDAVHVEITVEPTATAGQHAFRVVTPAGISNRMEVDISGTAPKEAQVSDQPLSQFPVNIEGRIAKRGDVNTYPILVTAGQTLTLEVSSGFRGLDPSIAIAEKSGSWFDPERVNRIAFNDEPLYFPGLSTDARLVHKFTRAGTYLLQVSSFSGQGGPDYVYELRIHPGVLPPPVLHPHLTDGWEERQFTRSMGADWASQVTSRGGEQGSSKGTETFRAVSEGSATVPVMTAPGVVEGRIEKPGEAHVIQLEVDKAQDLAIEIETPEATMPRFNPIVRLTESGGSEIVTNVYTKLNNNGLYMMKMIQPKTVFSLSAPGVYNLQIRDITTDRGGKDFAYRVMVRPQIPHIGKLVCSADHFNLQLGETKTLTVTLDREEEFGGVVALEAQGLPAGVIAVAAMEKPVERPPLPNGGKLERYTPKPQIASLLLVTSADAAVSTEPAMVRVVARPVVKGHLGAAIPVAEIPVMIVARRPS